MDAYKCGRFFARACAGLSVLLFPVSGFIAMQVLIPLIQPTGILGNGLLWIVSLITGLAVAFPLYGMGIFLRAVLDIAERHSKPSRTEDLSPEEQRALAEEYFPYLRPSPKT